MAVQRAVAEPKFAPLNSDFARSFVARHFGQAAADAIYEALPKITRGKNKGQVKGLVLWTKCSVGGWYRGDNQGWNDGGPSGYVLRPGSHKVRIVANHYGPSLEAGARRGAHTDSDWTEWCVRAINEIFQGGK